MVDRLPPAIGVWVVMRIRSLLISLAVTIAISLHSEASARVWSVERDGTGDFRDIQPAVNASAAGDTIRIGPGRFDQLHPCVAPAWTEDAIVAVVQDNLTFIGSGVDQTILGMVDPYWWGSSAPKGFCSVDSYSAIIKDMTIENIKTGIYWWRGVLTVENCILRGSHGSFLGAGAFVDDGSFTNCRFEIGGNAVGLACTFTDSLDVSNCVFEGYGHAFTTGASAGWISFTDCEFIGGTTAMSYAFGSSGFIRNTTVTQFLIAGLVVLGNSVPMELEDVHIVGGQHGIIIDTGAGVSGVDVVIEETTIESIEISSDAVVAFNNSHILPATGGGVRAYGYIGNQFDLDFSGNYWGTTDADSIAAMIEDGIDDPGVHCTIQFEPFAPGPVPTEKKPLGSVKSMFR